MQVRLKDLKPNPLRDFKVDPIDKDRVDDLAKSIRDDGFWGGVVCRRNGHGVQVIAGHHRVAAAIQAGLGAADVFIGDGMDDTSALRIYARENELQRGNSSTAVAGSVAAALRIAAGQLFRGVRAGKFASSNTTECLQKLSQDGSVGRDAISGLLPSLKDGEIKAQLANLRTSGAYARIVGEVRAEIDEEAKRAEREAEEGEKQRARAASERAKKATEQASKQERTFDHESVSAIFKNAHQVSVFRDLVTKSYINADGSQIVPVSAQAALAKGIARAAKDTNSELTGAFIRRECGNQIDAARGVVRKKAKKDAAAKKRTDLTLQRDEALRDIDRAFRLLDSALLRLAKLLPKWPKEMGNPLPGAFFAAFDRAFDALTKFKNTMRGIRGR